jgi:hypothetical protein
MSPLDFLLINGIKLIILIPLFLINRFFSKSEIQKKIFKIGNIIILVISFISAIGQSNIDPNTDVLLHIINTSLFLEIFFFQPFIFLIFGFVWFKSSDIKAAPFFNVKMFSFLYKYKYIILIAIIAVTGIFYFRTPKLLDCELNFIEGVNISKSVYLRIQDDNRDLNSEELNQIAVAASGDFQSNLRNVYSRSVFYKTCLRDERELNFTEKTFLKNKLLKFSELQNDYNAKSYQFIDSCNSIIQTLNNGSIPEYLVADFNKYHSDRLKDFNNGRRESYYNYKRPSIEDDLAWWTYLQLTLNSGYIQAKEERIINSQIWRDSVKNLNFREDQIFSIINEFNLEHFNIEKLSIDTE